MAMDQDDNTIPETGNKAMEDVNNEAESIWHPGPPAEAISLALSQGKLFLVYISQPQSDSTPDSPWTPIWSDATIK